MMKSSLAKFFLVLSLLLSSCGLLPSEHSDGAEQGTEFLRGTEWRLEGVVGGVAWDPPPDQKYTAFFREDGVFSGALDCAGAAGEYELRSEGRIRISLGNVQYIECRGGVVQ